MRKHKLIELDWPVFGECERPQGASCEEFEGRIAAARAAMAERGLTHLVVYADREHFANLAYLTGFEPRFEEAMLILGSRAVPLIVVGNECEGYLKISPLWVNGKLRSERFQPFSLLDQPRENSRQLHDIFRDEGIGPASHVGCAGWKYYSRQEHPLGERAIEIPAYMVDTLRDLASAERVVNATAIFMEPDRGLRTFCSPTEIAYFEYTNILASEGLKRMIFGLREGMLDYDLAKLAEYNGEPQGCHMTLKSGAHRIGLASPIGVRIQRGGPLSTNICYWGSNSCRVGWVVGGPGELPVEAREYVAQFGGPYFEAISEWFGLLRIGTGGGALDEVIRRRLPFEKFGIYLNAGHLIHLDEWVSSPVYKGSQVKIHSGMAMQVDVIPSSKTFFSARMEDGVVIADAALRGQLAAKYPAMLARCQARRKFMIDVLGIDVPEEVLPLSNIPGIVPPFFLAPRQVFAMGD
jgi:hypothetical protein